MGNLLCHRDNSDAQMAGKALFLGVSELLFREVSI